MLVREPGSEITLIEEVLRWETPVQTVTRRATRDLELEPGVVIPKDQTVLSPSRRPNGMILTR
jgi:cytochrome P450